MLVVVGVGLAAGTGAEEAGLRSPDSFAGIADPAERAAALFEEAGKVITGPRCVNCHPAGDRPLQGDDGHPHQPWVRRGSDGHGVAGLRCSTCHGSANFDAAGVPGNPKWALAPIEMAWQGRSPGEICAQIKDPEHNGGRSLLQIVAHVTEDSLVGWAWAPGRGRAPAAGSQAAFGALIRAWVESGAACPPP
jgi:hypothetical protein